MMLYLASASAEFAPLTCNEALGVMVPTPMFPFTCVMMELSTSQAEVNAAIVLTADNPSLVTLAQGTRALALPVRVLLVFPLVPAWGVPELDLVASLEVVTLCDSESIKAEAGLPPSVSASSAFKA